MYARLLESLLQRRQEDLIYTVDNSEMLNLMYIPAVRILRVKT